MLLASPLPCDNLGAQSNRTLLFSPLPLSSLQRTNSRSSSIPLSIQRTCNALQSLLAGAASPAQNINTASNAPVTTTNAPTHRRPQDDRSGASPRSPTLVKKPVLAPAPTRPELQKRRASRLSLTTTHSVPAEKVRIASTPPPEQISCRPTTPPPALRGANKRKRSDSDDASRSNNDSQSPRAPSTPKRQRRLPVDLPQGLREADFDSIPEHNDIHPRSSAQTQHLMPPRRRSYQDDGCTVRQLPSRVLQRPAHHRRASSSAMMSLFFTTLQLDTSTSVRSFAQEEEGEQSQRLQPHTSVLSDTQPHTESQPRHRHHPSPSADHTSTTPPPTALPSSSPTSTQAPPEDSSILLKSWEDAQLEQISRGMAVRGRMRIRRPYSGGRVERARVDGMEWLPCS